MSYKYKNPLDNGYIKVPKNKYKEIIPNYKYKAKYKIYENDECYLIHQFKPFWIVILDCISLPFIFLVYGFLEIKESIYELIFQKGTGSFYSYIVNKNKSKQDSINNTLSKIK